MEWTVRRIGIGRLPGRRMVALKSNSSNKPFEGVAASRILFGVTAGNRAPASFAPTKCHPPTGNCRVNPTLHDRPLALESTSIKIIRVVPWRLGIPKVSMTISFNACYFCCSQKAPQRSLTGRRISGTTRS